MVLGLRKDEVVLSVLPLVFRHPIARPGSSVKGAVFVQRRGSSSRVVCEPGQHGVHDSRVSWCGGLVVQVER